MGDFKIVNEGSHCNVVRISTNEVEESCDSHHEALEVIEKLEAEEKLEDDQKELWRVWYKYLDKNDRWIFSNEVVEAKTAEEAVEVFYKKSRRKKVYDVHATKFRES